MAKSNADRQKAYRERKRNAQSVTERNVTDSERNAKPEAGTYREIVRDCVGLDPDTGDSLAPGQAALAVYPSCRLPFLPDDEVVACNKDIGWSDILAMSKADIDYVYKTWKSVGDSILLRLKRAAGYHARSAA